MPTVTGQFVDNTGANLGGLAVKLRYWDLTTGWLPWGSDTTSSTGNFSISINPFGLALMGGAKVARIEVVDRVGRVMFRSPNQSVALFSDLPMGTLTIHRLDMSGWRVTNRTGAISMFSSGNDVGFVLDNEDAWSQIVTDVRAATNQMQSLQFYFDVNNLFVKFPTPFPPVGTAVTGDRLEHEILVRARPPTSANVFLAVRHHLGRLGGALGISTGRAVDRYYSTTHTGHSVDVKQYVTDVRLPMHAKVLIYHPNKAQIMGSPLMQEYFDDQQHVIDQPRRGPFSTPKNAIKVPIHDVDLRIEGEAVHHLHETFVLHWNRTGTPLGIAFAMPAVPASSPNVRVQIVRSLPPFTPSLPEGETGVFEAYLRMFRAATDFVYIENQYVLQMSVLAAMREALRLNENVQIIILMNGSVDIPFYQTLQNMRISRLLRDVRSDGNQARLGIFTIWTHDTSTTRHRLVRNYVHSKVAVADDKWATVGSANLDGVSLEESEHIIHRGITGSRATEVNALLLGDVDGLAASTVPASLRRALWAEHLGFSSPTDPALATRPSGGWIELWNARAAAKLAGLTASTPTSHAARILRWRPQANPTRHLRDLGVPVNNFNVLSNVRGYDFTRGQWQ